MIKSLLVILDESEASESAKKLGIQLAKSHKASLSGIGVLDTPWITAPEAIPLGGASFKVELEAKVLGSTKHHIRTLEQNFMDDCKKHKTEASIIDTEGLPAEEIEYFAAAFDLLVIGKDANFHFAPGEEISTPVKQLLKDSPRPFIVTGSRLPAQNNSTVLIAYDGTFAASRTLHMAILLGFLEGKTIHIASVNENEESARKWINSAAQLCHYHGLKTHIHPIATAEKPSIALLKLAEDVKPSLIVMGAYGHSTIRAFFMGSCTKELMQGTEIPLFVFH